MQFPNPREDIDVKGKSHIIRRLFHVKRTVLHHVISMRKIFRSHSDRVVLASSSSSHGHNCDPSGEVGDGLFRQRSEECIIEQYERTVLGINSNGKVRITVT